VERVVELCLKVEPLDENPGDPAAVAGRTVRVAGAGSGANVLDIRRQIGGPDVVEATGSSFIASNDSTLRCSSRICLFIYSIFAAVGKEFFRYDVPTRRNSSRSFQ